jgi:hypothetical protein
LAWCCDIGTSPLYSLKTVFDVTGRAASEPAAILGALSLILWALIIVTTGGRGWRTGASVAGAGEAEL